VERFQEKLQTLPVRKRDQIKDLEHFVETANMPRTGLPTNMAKTQTGMGR